MHQLRHSETISVYSRLLSLYEVLLAESSVFLLNFSFIDDLFCLTLLLIDNSCFRYETLT